MQSLHFGKFCLKAWWHLRKPTTRCVKEQMRDQPQVKQQGRSRHPPVARQLLCDWDLEINKEKVA